MYVCMCVYACVYVCVYVCMCICMCICVYVYMYAYMCVCRYVCMYVCMSERCITKLGMGTQWVTGMMVGHLKKKKNFGEQKINVDNFY